jgi:hypothetical protein
MGWMVLKHRIHITPPLRPPRYHPPEVPAIDKLPGKVTIPDKFQRRIVSDFQASYGFTRALTPDPEMLLQLLEEGYRCLQRIVVLVPRPEVESTPGPQTHDDPKEPEVQPPTEPTPELQTSTPEDTPPLLQSTHLEK